VRGLLELSAPLVLAPMRSPDGRGTELVTRDPDGTRIHFVQQDASGP
jgi:hypothetical protein